MVCNFGKPRWDWFWPTFGLKFQYFSVFNHWKRNFHILQHLRLGFVARQFLTFIQGVFCDMFFVARNKQFVDWFRFDVRGGLLGCRHKYLQLCCLNLCWCLRRPSRLQHAHIRLFCVLWLYVVILYPVRSCLFLQFCGHVNSTNWRKCRLRMVADHGVDWQSGKGPWQYLKHIYYDVAVARCQISCWKKGMRFA